MTDKDNPFEGQPKPFPPSPFASGATPSQPAAKDGSPPKRRGRVLLTGAALTLLVVVASAAGAAIDHEFWAPAQVAALPSSDAGTSGGSARSGFPFGNGFSGNGSGTAGGGNGSGFFGQTPSGSSANASGGPSNVSSIAARVSPALVDIDARYGYQGAAGAGTGIVVSSDGVVLTNNHVIDGATDITVTDVGNRKVYDATVLGYDPTHDLAVLQLQGASGLETAKIGDSSSLHVGDSVVGIGNAGGAGGTPSSAGGAVTGLGKSITAADDGSSEQLSGLIETNAGIQPGDSGGPLVDSQGHVIGIDTAGSEGFSFSGASGDGFAIPIDQAIALGKQIASGKGSATVHVGSTAFLGISVGESAGFDFQGFGQAPSNGVSVGQVIPGQPAEKAGLAAGDVITSVDGHSISTPKALSELMFVHHPRDSVKIGWVDSSGRSHTSSVQLGSGPPA